MAGVNGSAQWTQSNAIAQPVLVDGCHVILETSPPDCVEKISRYLDDSVAPCSQNQGCNDPAGADSDSGDSLFLTQEPVPEAVRTGRRRHYYKSRSDPGSPSDLLESEDDDSHGESKAGKERRRKTRRLPKYNFPFLTERKWKSRSSLLPVQQNTNLHNHTMAGFFKCVRELWQGYQTGETMESSLPTVDRDGDYISPLSEEEEERSEDEGIKVVEKKCFVVLSKAKRQQTWKKQLKQQRRTETNDARQKKMEKTQGRQWKMLHKMPAKPFISKVTQLSSDTSDHGEFFGKGPVEKERNHECVRSDVNVPAQTETPNTERRLTRRKNKIPQKAREEELQSSPKQCTQKDRETSTTETEAQTCAFHKDDDLPQTGQAEESQHLHLSLPDLISDTNDDRVCADTGVKKKKDKGGDESGEEGQGQQSREEPRVLDASTCVTVELEETPSLSEDNGAEPPAPQPSDELQINENNCMEKLSQDDNALSRVEGDIPDSKQKKRKKKAPAAENVEEVVSGNLESDVRMTDSVFSVSCNVEDSGQVKKKKKKRKRSAEDAGQSVAEPLNDVAAIEKEKKKRKKEGRILITEECVEEEVSNGALDQPPMSAGHLEEYGHCLESTAPSEETLESTYVKRKKHKKKHQPSANDARQDGEMVADVSFSNDAVTLSENVGMPLKKKKKKKKEKTLSEDVEISQTPEENEKVENLNNTQKTKEGLEDTDTKVTKKKKRKMREISNRNISEDGVAQSDDSVSVRKKEKKGTSSFLVADAEETDAVTHVEPNCPSQLADAHVWGAERPVSPAGFRTESAEVAGNLEELNGSVRKKKKKRKMSVEQDMVEKDHEQNFEEPSETCAASPLPENTNAEVKRKKKRTRNESESVTPVERLESSADVGHSPTDEAVVLKKKKKKKKRQDEHCYVIQESPPTATQSTLNNCSSASHKEKGKQLTDPLAADSEHGRTPEISHDGGTSDQATKETMSAVDHASPSSQTNQASNDRRDKKKKKKLKSADSPEGKSLTKSAELAPQENKKKKKKERNEQSAVPSLASSSPVLSETSLSKCKMSSSDSVVNKQVKRRLHNPNEDFLTD